MDDDHDHHPPLDTRLLTSPDGVGVALHDLGGDGPPLLLSHGNGLNSGMWAGALPALCERFHCFGLDLRGHGACGGPDEGYSVARDRFADDVLVAIEALGDAPVSYAAHSLGGASGLFAARREPDLFERLWLFEPVVQPVELAKPRTGPVPIAEIARNRREYFSGVDDLYDRLISKPPYASCDQRSVRAYVELGLRPSVGVELEQGAHRLSCTGENEARVFETGEPQDFADFAVITCPTVVACGSRSAPPGDMPEQLAPHIATALPNAVLERHDHLSHFGPMEDPATIAASIIAHMAP